MGKILKADNPKLRQKSKPIGKIDKKVLSLIADLKRTLLAQTNPEGVGLAAPQIGRNFRIFVIKSKDKVRVFINPEIIFASKTRKANSKGDEKKMMEGCLSLPHFYGPLERPQNLKVGYLNERGKKATETFTGFEAQIIQHEIDHLNGILFVDRLLKQKKPLYELVGDEWKEVDF